MKDHIFEYQNQKYKNLKLQNLTFQQNLIWYLKHTQNKRNKVTGDNSKQNFGNEKKQDSFESVRLHTARILSQMFVGFGQLCCETKSATHFASLSVNLK